MSITDSDIREATVELGARLALHEFLLEKILVLAALNSGSDPLIRLRETRASLTQARHVKPNGMDSLTLEVMSRFQDQMTAFFDKVERRVRDETG